MSALVRRVTRYHVLVTATVRAKVEARLSFTDEDVREWADLDGDEPVDPELIEEYAAELIGEEGDLEVKDVEYWGSTDVDVLRTESTMSAPAEFVALPGMEGL